MKVFDRVHDASKALPLYWDRTDHWYNFATNVRGISHMLATVVEDPFGPQPQGATLDGIAGGTMGAQPSRLVLQGLPGRALVLHRRSATRAEAFDATLTTHLKGAISWAAGTADPVYSDCGATVLRNYQQTKVGSPPNLQEPIGFDQLPDGRILQTDRLGSLRLHDAVTGTTRVVANFTDPSPADRRSASTPPARTGSTARPSTRTSRPTSGSTSSTPRRRSPTSSCPTGDDRHADHADHQPPNTAASKTAWDPYVGYHQLSRFKFVEDANGPRLDMGSEQQILKVPMNRQECCHVAGDIDFDKHGNMWLVTGDDTPAGGINAGG